MKRLFGDALNGHGLESHTYRTAEKGRAACDGNHLLVLAGQVRSPGPGLPGLTTSLYKCIMLGMTDLTASGLYAILSGAA